MHSRHTSRHVGVHTHLNVSDLVVGLTREAVRASSSQHCHHGCTHHCSHGPVQVQQVHHHHHHPPRGGRRGHHAPPPHVAPVVPAYAVPPPPTGAYIRIVRATYGAGMHQRDVTDALQRLVLGQGGLSLNAFGSNQSMNTLFGDPLHGARKTLQFSYEVVGQPQALTLSEDRKINLVMGEMYQQSAGHASAPSVASHFDLVLLQSSYGFGECRYDVSSVLGAMIAQHGGKGLSAFGYFFSPNGCMNKAFGDPAPGKDKDLRVSYLWRTPVMSCTAVEDQHVCLAYDALRPLL